MLWRNVDPSNENKRISGTAKTFLKVLMVLSGAGSACNSGFCWLVVVPLGCKLSFVSLIWR